MSAQHAITSDDSYDRRSTSRCSPNGPKGCVRGYRQQSNTGGLVAIVVAFVVSFVKGVVVVRIDVQDALFDQRQS